MFRRSRCSGGPEEVPRKSRGDPRTPRCDLTTRIKLNKTSQQLIFQTMANNMQKFPIADLQYGEATNAGLYTVCKAIHPSGYMAVQLPPCTLAFDAVDPNSRFAPKLKLKVGNSEQIAWPASGCRRR